jgi:hypothetical protein
MRAQPRQQHAQTERLRHVVVGTRIEPEHCIGIAVRSGQHKDRYLHPGVAQHSAQFAPIHVRQPDIEQNGVKPLGAGDPQRLRPAVALYAGEFAIQLKLFGERQPQRSIIVDDQYPAASPHSFLPNAPVSHLIMRQIRAPHPRRGVDVSRIAPLLPVAPGSRDGR